MSRMNIKPAFSYRFKEMLKSAAVFYAMMMALVLLLTIINRNSSVQMNISAFGMAASIFMFVIGICTPREQLRLCIQLGAGRLTSFISELLCAVAVTLCLCAAGEILMAAAQAIAAGSRITVTDIYKLLYVRFDTDALSFPQHLMSMLTNASFSICAYAGGALISLVFFRLSKPLKVLVAVGVPLLLMFGLPYGIMVSGTSNEFSRTVVAVMEWLSVSAGNWLLLFFGGAMVIAALNWLLMRKAPITEAKR